MNSNNKYVFALLVVVVFTINSFFILQVRRSATDQEESTTDTFSHHSRLVYLTSRNMTVNNARKPSSNARRFEPFNSSLILEEPGINVHNFTYLLNNEHICAPNNGENMLLIAFVPIAICNFAGRNMIRQTWSLGNRLASMKVVFLVGETRNETLTKELHFESRLYGDIIQEDFVDTYKNLTLKTVMGLKWVSAYCSKAKFALKVDDDTVVNVGNLLAYLNETSSKNVTLENTLLCRKLSHKLVKRDESVKFFISKKQFFPDEYPTYCDGPAYLLTTDVAQRFYNISSRVSSFIWEDVYMGLLAAKANASFLDLTESYTRAFRFYMGLANVTYESSFFIYSNNINEFSFVWNHVFDRIRNLIF